MKGERERKRGISAFVRLKEERSSSRTRRLPETGRKEESPIKKKREKKGKGPHPSLLRKGGEAQGGLFSASKKKPLEKRGREGGRSSLPPRRKRRKRKITPPGSLPAQ